MAKAIVDFVMFLPTYPSPQEEFLVKLYFTTTNKTCRRISYVNTLRTGSFKLFKRPFPGFLTILTLTPSSTTSVFGEYFLKISVYKNS